MSGIKTAKNNSFKTVIIVSLMAIGLLYSSCLFAATAKVPLNEQTRSMRLDSMVDVLEDKTGVLSWADVTNGKNDGLWFPCSGNLNFGFTDSAYWVRVVFLNESDKALPILLDIAYPVIDLINVHILRKSDHESFEMGDSLPFNQRPMHLKDFVFPLSFEPGETVTVFMRFKSVNSMQMPLTLYQPDNFIKKKQMENMALGIYYGAMAVLMIYNLFLFSSIRDVDYLFYSMYVFFLCMFLASVNGINFQYFFPNEPQWNDRALGVFLNLTVVMGTLFAICFLKLKQVWPMIYRLFCVFPLIGASFALLALIIPYHRIIIWTIGLMMAAFMFGMPVTIIRWLKGFSPTRFYLVGWLALLGGGILLGANKLGILPRLPWTENSTKVGSVIQVVLLSIALADRLNTERRDKIEAQKKAEEEERSARIAQEKALQNEKKERAAREEVYALQKKARETLEILVTERKKELDKILDEINLANSRIMSSLRYARVIQVAVLPDPEQIRAWIPSHFIWWVPRDVVGGDFYFLERVKGITIVCVADCTGHGVHGAFMTIISGFELKRIIHGEGCTDPGDIIERLNKRIRAFLKPKSGQVFLDDGLCIGICTMEPKQGLVRYAGARMNLHVLYGRKMRTVEGSRKGVGYLVSDDDMVYDEYQIDYDPKMKMYLATDGITGQLGARSGRRFGSVRLKQILTEHAELPLNVQQEILEASLNVFKGYRDQVDDITMVGFSPN